MYLTVTLITARNVVRKGNVFSLVTARVAKRAKVMFSQACVTHSVQWRRGEVTPPQHPPVPTTPATPHNTPSQHPPSPHQGIQSMCGWYASYLNASLSVSLFTGKGAPITTTDLFKLVHFSTPPPPAPASDLFKFVHLGLLGWTKTNKSTWIQKKKSPISPLKCV